MSFANSLRLTWHAGLPQAAFKKGVSTAKLLSRKSGTVCSVAGSGFDIYCVNPKDPAQYFAFEADRFASASFESLLSVPSSNDYPKSVGWILIRYYYAAFFAAHCLLRLRGVACARVLQDALCSVNDDARSIFGLAPGYFGGGLYTIELDSNSRSLACLRLQSGASSHEVLWDVFSQHLDWLVNLVGSHQDPQHQELLIAVADFQDVVRRFGGIRWFTRLRNEINYSHGKGAWFPYEGGTVDAARIGRVMDGWSDAAPILGVTGDEVIQFTYACRLLVSMCGVTVKDFSRRSVSNSPFRRSSRLLLARV